MSLPASSQQFPTILLGNDIHKPPVAEWSFMEDDTKVEIYEHSLTMFQDHARQQYVQLSQKSESFKNNPSKLARFGWVQLAGVINPSAAMDFDTIAEAAESLQNLHNLAGEHEDWQARTYDPLSYLEDNQSSIPQCWIDRLRGWKQDLTQSRISSADRRHEMQVQMLRTANKTIGLQLVKLEHHMEAGYFRDDPDHDHIYACVDAALRAAQSLHTRLNVIETDLESFLQLIKSNAPSLKDVQMYNHLTDNGNGVVRRRQGGRIGVGSNDQPHSGTQSHPNGDQSHHQGRMLYLAIKHIWMQRLLNSLLKFLFRVLDSVGDLLRTLQHTAKTFRDPSQETLMTIVLFIGLLSGVFVGIALIQNRPPDCIPNQQTRDDGFYSLISQLLLQMLSLYCTMVPLIRDKAVELRTWQFNMAVVGSVAAAIVAPTTYGFSWKVSMVAGFISAFAALLASVQLAGWVEKHTQELNSNHAQS